MPHYPHPKLGDVRPSQLLFTYGVGALIDLHHAERVQPLDPAVAHPGDNIADLLWFPTGGGKTEAYLGLAAYTMEEKEIASTVEVWGSCRFGIRLVSHDHAAGIWLGRLPSPSFSYSRVRLWNLVPRHARLPR